MNLSVHAGSSLAKGSHAVFHWPSARMLSQAGVAGTGRCAKATARASASAKSIGAPKLQLWMDITDAIFSTVSISSRVAPAAMAALMCRRVPSGLRLVQAALRPTPTSSTNFRGSTPFAQGSSVMDAHVVAHDGSQPSIVPSAESQGPISRERLPGWSVGSAHWASARRFHSSRSPCNPRADLAAAPG